MEGLNHGFAAMTQLDGQAPRIPEHGEFIAIDLVRSRDPRGPGVYQAFKGFRHTVTPKRDMQKQWIHARVIRGFYGRIVVNLQHHLSRLSFALRTRTATRSIYEEHKSSTFLVAVLIDLKKEVCPICRYAALKGNTLVKNTKI